MSHTFDWLSLNNGGQGVAAGEFSEVVIEALIERYTARGSAAIDCGSADGRMLRPMLKAVGPRGAVIGFEPIPHVFHALRRSFPQPNAIILQACVADSNKDSVTFYYAKDRRWISSLSPDGLNQYDVQVLTVPVTTLDVVSLSEPAITGKEVSFIKLDIEGAEFSALRGGASLIARSRPFIVFENRLAGAATSFCYSKEEFFGFFSDLHYRLFDVMGTPLTIDLWDSVGKQIAWNFVAIHSDDPRLGDFMESIPAILTKSRRSVLPQPQIMRILSRIWRV